MDFEERKHGFKLSEIAFRFSGKKAVIEKENIKGKELTLIITFPNKSTYEKEYKEWTEYQDRIFKQREKGQESEGFKIYKLIKNKPVTYQEFTKISTPYISRILFQVFNDNPSLFMNEKETLQIKISRVERWGYDETKQEHEFIGGFPYSMPEPFVKKAMKTGIMDLEHYYVKFSVFYILQSIVVPHIYLKRIDHNFLYRYLMHEFEHYKQLAEGAYQREYEFGIKLSKHMLKSSDYTLQYLWWMLCSLQKEGLATYRTSMNASRIMIIPQYHKEFEGLLTEMCKIKDKNESEKYFNDKIYSSSKQGVYYCGTIMAFIVAYSIEPKESYIIVEKETQKVFRKTPGIELKELQNMFEKNKPFFITPPSKKAYEQAYNILNEASPEEYLLIYENACKKLGLKNDSVLLTTAFLKSLWKDAEYIFEKRLLEKIKKEDFYPRL